MGCIEMKNNPLKVAMTIAQTGFAFSYLSFIISNIIFGTAGIILSLISVGLTVYGIQKGFKFSEREKTANIIGFLLLFLLHVYSITTVISVVYTIIR